MLRGFPGSSPLPSAKVMQIPSSVARIEPEAQLRKDPVLSNSDCTPYFDDEMPDRIINE